MHDDVALLIFKKRKFISFNTNSTASFHKALNEMGWRWKKRGKFHKQSSRNNLNVCTFWITERVHRLYCEHSS